MVFEIAKETCKSKVGLGFQSKFNVNYYTNKMITGLQKLMIINIFLPFFQVQLRGLLLQHELARLEVLVEQQRQSRAQGVNTYQKA